jgi:hypothetical protein
MLINNTKSVLIIWYLSIDTGGIMSTRGTLDPTQHSDLQFNPALGPQIIRVAMRIRGPITPRKLTSAQDRICDAINTSVPAQFHSDEVPVRTGRIIRYWNYVTYWSLLGTQITHIGATAHVVATSHRLKRSEARFIRGY